MREVAKRLEQRLEELYSRAQAAEATGQQQECLDDFAAAHVACRGHRLLQAGEDVIALTLVPQVSRKQT